MARVEKAIEIERPVRVVYEVMTDWRWSPDEGEEFRADVVEQVPDEVVAWRGTDEDADTWRASLIALSPKRTRVDLAIEHDPHGLLDRAAEAFGSLQRRLDDDLQRLKAHVEASSPPPR
jgi:uncharacterized membrane protein